MELTQRFVRRSEATITQAAILALALALSASAEAHDLDCRGMPVSQAEKLGCCGAGDAHFAAASQFYEDEDGFWHFLVAGEDLRLVRGTPENMTKIEPLPSADGCYTVWFRVWSDSGKFVPGEIRAGMTPDEVRFYCLEIPPAM
ncbi:MAG: hypothetical protein JO223_08490 [Hyphomicrobiales bacterium]|nr:hypothetical protein [Hyphomicrobiales bacterium]MBV8439420.1 hypothetical protein [Hyphomicrobiales bacterium]